MNKTPDYWQAIESTYGMKAASVTWDKYLGTEKARLSKHIRPTGRLVNTYPCPDKFGCGFDHEIRIWRETDIAAVPVDDEYDRCRVYKLRHEDIVEYEMDAESILRETFRMLGVRPGELRPTDFYETYAVGTCSLDSGSAMQVYLTIPEERKQFCQAATGLLAVGETPFVFMSLTPRFMDTVALEGLARHKCPFFLTEDLVAASGQGDLTLLRGLADILRSQYTTDEAPRLENVFRLDGAAWTMSYAGETVHFPDTKGFRYIALLLAEAGRRWSVEALLAAAGNGAAMAVESAAAMQGADLRMGNSWAGHAGPVIDEQAKRQYRARLQQIEEEIEDAGILHDSDRLAALAQEKETLQREIFAAVGSQGKIRMAANGGEKASDAVSKAIRRGTDLIGAEHPRLAHHLRDAIKRGYTLSYEPESPTVWQTN
ncbi:MAG: hypothetical protein KA184_17595 [Candidatus Hydrogenedentes bacterium]|nr:hypothetical protein [Candidatus Hydrogenedentota bacterium]